MKCFAVWKVPDQFFTSAGIFSFAGMFFSFNQFWFFCIGVCKICRLIKKRHLSLNIKDGCLFRLCSIKFTGQEISLLLQERSCCADICFASSPVPGRFSRPLSYRLYKRQNPSPSCTAFKIFTSDSLDVSSKISIRISPSCRTAAREEWGACLSGRDTKEI